jgi:hypothetical protein
MILQMVKLRSGLSDEAMRCSMEERTSLFRVSSRSGTSGSQRPASFPASTCGTQRIHCIERFEVRFPLRAQEPAGVTGSADTP